MCETKYQSSILISIRNYGRLIIKEYMKDETQILLN